MHLSLFVKYSVIIYLCSCCFSLQLTEVSIPKYGFRNSYVDLGCVYRLEEHSLYCVKWYKDGRQFFQFVPGRKGREKTVYPIGGIQLNTNFSSQNFIRLENLSWNSSGVYQCEVISEAPDFVTGIAQKRLTVVDLPDGKPRIGRLRSVYHRFAKVVVNCTSEFSFPPAVLQWRINGNPVSKSKWIIKYPIKEEADNLTTTTIGLRMPVAAFPKRTNHVHLKCVAHFLNFYFSSEVKVAFHNQMANNSRKLISDFSYLCYLLMSYIFITSN